MSKENCLNESAFEAARKAYHRTHVGDYGALRAAISAYLNALSNEKNAIDGSMTDVEISQWIEACNHEPAKMALRDYLNLRAIAQKGKG